MLVEPFIKIMLRASIKEELLKELAFTAAAERPSVELREVVSAVARLSSQQQGRRLQFGLVDRLLASPHYGQRWARHWMDVARFAESGGFEHDADRPTAFHYRDFLIAAFNSDILNFTVVKER